MTAASCSLPFVASVSGFGRCRYPANPTAPFASLWPFSKVATVGWWLDTNLGGPGSDGRMDSGVESSREGTTGRGGRRTDDGGKKGRMCADCVVGRILRIATNRREGGGGSWPDAMQCPGVSVFALMLLIFGGMWFGRSFD